MDADQVELLDVLGEGAFGVVHKGLFFKKDGERVSSSEVVAVKVSMV